MENGIQNNIIEIGQNIDAETDNIMNFIGKRHIWDPECTCSFGDMDKVLFMSYTHYPKNLICNFHNDMNIDWTVKSSLTKRKKIFYF